MVVEVRCNLTARTGRVPVGEAVDPSSVAEAVHNLAGVLVHILDARNSGLHSPVEVAASRNFGVKAGRSLPVKGDTTVGRICLELHTAPRAARHMIDLQRLEVGIHFCCRKKNRWNQEAIWYATILLALPLIKTRLRTHSCGSSLDPVFCIISICSFS